MTRARERIARVEAKRPRPRINIALAASGQDRTADLDAWIDRVLDSAPPREQG